MPSGNNNGHVTKEAFAEIVLKDGQRFEVTETFATVLRHQREVMKKDEPLMEFMGPTGTRVAVDPIEVVSVYEIQRPTRQSPRKTPAASASKKKPAAKSEPAETRARRSRRPGRVRRLVGTR